MAEGNSKLITLIPSLLLAVLAANSDWARILGRYWQLLTPPQHLSFFNQKSITKALELNGFTINNIYHTGKISTINFILFKARETFGKIISIPQKIIKLIGLGKLRISVNLGDILTCIAHKN